MKIFLSFFIASLFFFASPVYSQERVCGEYGKVRTYLKENYSETVVGRGLSNTGWIFEIFASKEGSFTVVSVNPQGLACFLGEGTSWETVVDVEDTKDDSF